MKIYKFGGASVRTASAVKNVQSIVAKGEDKLVVVVSAMGKTTNALEEIVWALIQKEEARLKELIEARKEFHLEIMKELFEHPNHQIFQEVQSIFDSIIDFQNNPIEDYDFLYDQIVSLGEVVSTKIVAAYLSEKLGKVKWLDARALIRTDEKYRAANINWEKTEALLKGEIENSEDSIFVIQGFIGHTGKGVTTTLGREGSDFTAGIIAYCLQAKSVTIWKDVPGMLNADPKWFENTVKIDKISYREAVELAYYGASVIHPKTIKPLENKEIPLYIKSFIEPEKEGTIIQKSMENDALIPSFIFKVNQVLLSITPKDFSFVVEENLSDIFRILAHNGVHINIMQNSAVSFSVSLDIDKLKLEKLVKELSINYNTVYHEGLELVTIRHYNEETIERVTKNRELLMEQRTQQTVRIVMRKNEKIIL